MLSRRLATLLFLIGLFVVSCGPEPDQNTPSPTSLAAPTGERINEPYPSDNNGYPGPDEPAAESSSDVETGPVDFAGQLAFHSERSGNLQVHVLDGESGVTEKLSNAAEQAYEPSWSPACDAIAYTQELPSGDSEIYSMRADGTNEAPLLTTARPETLEWAPAWSPAGDSIAFQSNPEALINVCFSTTTGEFQNCLERTTFSNAHPSWSPDGQTLLFVSNRTGNYEVFKVDMVGDNPPVQLTDNGGVNFHPRFSPDGQYIVFESERKGNFDIYSMRADGSDERQLTQHAEDDVDPSWLGSRIVFASYRSRDWELYVVNRDGSGLARLTSQPDDDKGPIWCSGG